MYKGYQTSHRLVASLLLVIFLLESCTHGNISIQPQKEKKLKSFSNTHQECKAIELSGGREALLNISETQPHNMQDQQLIKHGHAEAVVGNVGEKDIAASKANALSTPDNNFTSQQKSLDNRPESTSAKALQKSLYVQAQGKIDQQEASQNHQRALEKKAIVQPVAELLLQQSCVVKGGHQVSFRKNEQGRLEALVQEHCPVGFSKIYSLPVIVALGLRCSETAVKKSLVATKFHPYIT